MPPSSAPGHGEPVGHGVADVERREVGHDVDQPRHHGHHERVERLGGDHGERRRQLAHLVIVREQADQRLERAAAEEVLEGEFEQEGEGDLARHEEGDRGQERHGPAQERAGEDADRRQDHRLEPDAEEPLHEVRAEVARVGEQEEVALGHPEILRRADAVDLDHEVAAASRPAAPRG